jgi:hypothetical protein
MRWPGREACPFRANYACMYIQHAWAVRIMLRLAGANSILVRSFRRSGTLSGRRSQNSAIAALPILFALVDRGQS